MFADEYDLLEKIHEDSSFIDFKARKKGCEDFFIVKRFEYNKIDEEWEKAIQASIPIIKDINHPNIIRLVNIKDDSAYYYCIYEYCNGGFLEEYLNYLKKNNRTLSEEEAQYIMKQLVEAVKYLYNKKIVHRDIKPFKILIHYDSEEDLLKRNILKARIKLGGFEVSTYLKKGEFLDLFVGTHAYIAPEIRKRKRIAYNEKVDLWNLGVVFSDLLSSKIEGNDAI